eukprot:TRINITY_DN2645_c0_g1_i2.p1 TRINITY_DN2645_c0_g1~~TRINITY_DN2645_c0_g1_i2.p1  ORF type:complete len:317 (-),score=136.90 TRINITY_DN2645_c0_g1_i2:331-1281(-)
MWNATKFVLMSLGDDFVPETYAAAEAEEAAEHRQFIERWILSLLTTAIENASDGISEYLFSKSTTACYSFFLNDFCGVLIEVSKPFLGDDVAPERRRSFRNTLYTCLDVALRLLHPYMPFVTEELWQRIPRRPDESAPSIMVAPYPKPVAHWKDEVLEARVRDMQDIVQGLRALKQQYNIPDRKRLPAVLRCATEEVAQVFAEYGKVISTLAYLEDITVSTSPDTPPQHAVKVLSETYVVLLNMKGQLDVEQELAKLQKKQADLQKKFEKLQKKRSAATYDRVPQAAQEKDAKMLADMEQQLATTAQMIEDLSNFK